MGTKLRPVLSKKNPYWIGKHRYYELKHFCMQYPIWKKEYMSLDGLAKHDIRMWSGPNINSKNPTENCALSREYYLKRMELVEQAALQADADLADVLIQAVTEGWSYEILRARFNIPYCRDIYYSIYRKFFWILDKERQ